MAWPCQIKHYASLSASRCLRLLTGNLSRERTRLVQLLYAKSTLHIGESSVRGMTTKVRAMTYGGWKSPITSQLATESSVSFSELHVDKAKGNQGAVYWSELRFDEAGRYVICSRAKDKGDITEWTPKDFSARTRVHEYGGGAFFVHDAAVYFSNFVDQRLYMQSSPSDSPRPLTPDNSGWRYSDGQYNTVLKRIFCVREDHSLVEKGEGKEAVNTVVCINPDTQEQHVLASGCDFYSCPRVTADGSTIAWVQWNHPNMPWDDTELWVAELESSGDGIKKDSTRKVAGGKGVSIMYPNWTSDNELLYISDQSDWWNLYHLTADGKHVNLHAVNKELGSPQWVFADYPYDLDTKGRVVTSYGKEFAVLDLKTKDYRIVPTGYTSHGHIGFLPDSDLVYCTAGSPTHFPCVISVDVDKTQVTVLKESRSVPVDKAYLSVPEEISWPTGKDQVSHGYFYPPKNKDMEGVTGTLPPLLVRIHGGPTAQFSNVLSLGNQYFTSRGVAVLCVNYRGSTGYGRSYRHLLYRNWGIYDIEDCCSGATYLADKGLVDRNQLCIDGGSAGGYTTLAVLAFKDVFKAGASLYGVADLTSLANDTHKFESRYIEQLVAPTESIEIWNDRSPINHTDSFSCPIVLFQGDEDKIVLPNQAEMMFNALKKKGIPCAYVLYKGEQHGFRKAENIQKTLDGELYFFGRVFGFEPADKKGELEIANM